MKTLLQKIQDDLFLIKGSNKGILGILLYSYNPEFSFLFWYRICNYHYEYNNKYYLLFFRIFYRHTSIKYRYEIPYQCKIQSGL